MKKILALLLVFSTLLCFASCKGNPSSVNGGNSTNVNGTNNGDGAGVGTGATGNTVVGTWVYDETISPQSFYGDYYNPKITKNNVQMSTTYKFNADGTYSALISITNITDVRKEYRSLMVEGARQKIEKDGKFLTTEDVLYYEKYADDILNGICKEITGTYKIDGNKIVYGDSSSETFTIDGDKLTITGTSENGVDYIVNLKRK